MHDDHRFTELYREHFPAVVRLCERLLRGRGDAEGVAQEAFIRAWTFHARFAAERPFRPWICAIAQNLCLTQLRTGERRSDIFRKNELALVPPEAVEDISVPALDAAAVRAALRRLSPRDRRLIALSDIEGWDYDEIARFEGVTRESVRGSLKRARSAFRGVYRGLAGLGGVPDLLSRVGGHGRPARLTHWTRDWAVTAFGRFNGAELVAAAVVALVLSPVPSAQPSPPSADAVQQLATAPVPSTDELPTSPHVGGSGSSVAPVRATGTKSAPGPAPQPTAPDAAVVDGSAFTFTVSPSYEQDGTVFASGRDDRCTITPTDRCGLLVKSTDRGRTWARLSTGNEPRARIVLPPSYPRDPRLFSVGSVFSVSEDGGTTFRTVTGILPPQATPAISPRFADGDPRILFGSPWAVSTEYYDDGQSLVPSRIPLPKGLTPLTFAFSPTYATDGSVFVTTRSVLPTGGYEGLYRCATTCEAVLKLDKYTAAVQIHWRPGTGTAYVWGPWSMHRSGDGGQSWEAVAPPPGLSWRSSLHHLTSGPDGRLYGVWAESYEGGGSLFASDDHGTTWSLVHADLPDVSDVTVLPDGTLLASDRLSPGIDCSTDGGVTWRSCSAPSGS
jgi:RNA polymerase sigma-70 factor (ECF subfamily)